MITEKNGDIVAMLPWYIGQGSTTDKMAGTADAMAAGRDEYRDDQLCKEIEAGL